jgi:ribonuclease P protein component
MAGPERESEDTPERGAERARWPRSARLRRAADFRAAYRDGVRARGATVTLVVRPNGLAFSRLGLSVGKKCWKRAVRRNRVRRIFREAFRLSRAELPSGLDIVMIAATPGLDPRLDETRRELAELVARAERKLGRPAGGAPR